MPGEWGPMQKTRRSSTGEGIEAKPPVAVCPRCGSGDVRRRGFGATRDFQAAGWRFAALVMYLEKRLTHGPRYRCGECRYVFWKRGA